MLKQSSIVASAATLALSIFSPAIAQTSEIWLESSPVLLTSRLAEQLKQNRGDLMEKLNLSNSQRQEIQDIRQRHSSQLNRLTSQIRSARNTMKNLVQSNASRSQLENQYRTMSNLRGELADLKFQQMMDIRDVLTVSQRRDLADYLEEKKKHGHWFGDR